MLILCLASYKNNGSDSLMSELAKSSLSHKPNPESMKICNLVELIGRLHYNSNNNNNNNNNTCQFIKRRKWWFGPPHQGRFGILTMMGRECSRLDPTYQRHITLWMHRLLPTTSPSQALLPPTYRGTNLPTSKGWIAWLAKAECTHITFTQDYYTIESKDTRRK